jgi:3-dehydroquinate dehydratase-1
MFCGKIFSVMAKMKIALCLMAQDFEQLKKQFEENKVGPQDLYELRLDFLVNKAYEDIEAINELITFMRLNGMRPGQEIILTLRTESEGGFAETDNTEYLSLVQRYIGETYADIIDIEAFAGENMDAIEFLTNMAHENGRKVILSNHETTRTPRKEDIVQRLVTMEKLGADIPKVAYMANSEEDPQTLLAAAGEAKNILKVPFIALSMGELGKATRVCGGDFGSVISFGTAGNAQAAPGQMTVQELKKFFDIYYK